MSAVLMTLFAVSILGTLGMAVYGLRVLVGRWDRPRRHALRAVPKLPPLGPLQPARPAQAAPVWVAPAGSAPAPLVVPVGVATPLPLQLPAGGVPPQPPVFMPPQPVAAPQSPPLVFMPPQPVPRLPAFKPSHPIAATPPPPPPRAASTTQPPPLPRAPSPALSRAPSPALSRAPSPALSRAPSPALVPALSPAAPAAPGSPNADTLSPRLARGSIPPEYTGAELEPDTDPAVILDPAEVLEDAASSEPPVVQRGARFSVVRSTRR